MAVTTIETIGVKPSGFLASWRYVNVNIDENGTISNSNVPGKPNVNLDFISEYRSNDRAYANDQLITEFCNFTTHTKYKVYAKDERPFAYVVGDLDVPECGYETPLPEPAVPYNPFGNPTYNAYKTFDFCDIDGVQCSVLIEKKDYDGEVVQVLVGGKSPVKLSYKNVQNKLDVFRPLECTITFINSDTLLLSEFYTEDERTFRVTVTKDSQVLFKGYLLPDSCSEPFAKINSPISIKCTDGLGSLKTVTYPFPVGSTFDLKQSFIDIICYCLAPLNINLDISTICNVYEISMKNSLNDDPLAQAFINPLRLSDDKGKILTCYEVIKSVCEAWGMSIVQTNGKWMFYRSNELSNAVIRQRNYNYKGLFLNAQQITVNRVASNRLSNDIVALSGSNTQIIGAYKRVEVLSLFGKVPSILYNGDFEGWDGFNFQFWTRYGGINISRIQRTVKNSVGQIIPIQNYALQFNKRRDIAKYLQHSPIPIQQGDKIKVTYRIGQTPINNSSVSPTFVTFSFIIKLGEYYLYNENGGNTYEWVKTISYVKNRVDNPNGDLNTYVFGFEIPEAPVTGSMIVQLYGFGDGLEEQSTGVYTYDLVGTIDDIAFTKTSQSKENDNIGILNITDNLRYYTNKPDRIEILFGDYKERLLADQPLDSLYAIFIDNAYSTYWQEYGLSGKVVSFGMALAKAHLRAYQKAYANFQGSLKLVDGSGNFNYLDVIKFITPDDDSFASKRFICLGADIDLKSNEITNVDLHEVFDTNVVSVDNTVDYYPNAPEAIFIQDAQYTKVNGIFTDEFTNDFN